MPFDHYFVPTSSQLNLLKSTHWALDAYEVDAGDAVQVPLFTLPAAMLHPTADVKSNLGAILLGGLLSMACVSSLSASSTRTDYLLLLTDCRVSSHVKYSCIFECTSRIREVSRAWCVL